MKEYSFKIKHVMFYLWALQSNRANAHTIRPVLWPTRNATPEGLPPIISRFIKECLPHLHKRRQPASKEKGSISKEKLPFLKKEGGET
jgi:hypothetical protein